MAERNADIRWAWSTKLIVSFCILGLFAYLISRFGAVIPPLILAAILAFILVPLVNQVQRRFRMKRWLASVLIYVLIIGLLSIIPVLVVPLLVDQLSGLNLDMQEILLDIEKRIGEEIIIGSMSIDVSQALEELLLGLERLGEPVFNQGVGIVFDVIGSAVWVVFIVVISFYLVKDKDRFWGWVEAHIPPGYKGDYFQLRGEINSIWTAFFRGQLILAIVVALLFTAVGLILGLPFAFAMGIFAGLMEFIPSIGHGIWLTIASILMFFEGSTWLPLPNWVVMVSLIGLHFVFQQVDLNFLIPRIIGRRVHLHPLVVILGIIVGAVLAGVLGVVLAAPTISSARTVGRYIYARLLDLSPYPEGSA